MKSYKLSNTNTLLFFHADQIDAKRSLLSLEVLSGLECDLQEHTPTAAEINALLREGWRRRVCICGEFRTIQHAYLRRDGATILDLDHLGTFVPFGPGVEILLYRGSRHG